MNKIVRVVLLLCAVQGMEAQVNPWSYAGKIKFPVADSIAARPYLCTVNSSGRLYVISSNADDANAHNAIFYANAGDSVFKKWWIII